MTVPTSSDTEVKYKVIINVVDNLKGNVSSGMCDDYTLKLS